MRMQRLLSLLPLLLLLYLSGCAAINTESEFLQARKLFKAGQYQDAHQHALKAYQGVPTNLKYAGLLGWTFLKQGDFAGAERIFAAIHQEDPAHIAAIQGFAWLAYSRQRFDDADNWFRRELGWAEKHLQHVSWRYYDWQDKQYVHSIASDSYYGLGLVALARQAYGEAQSMLAKALEHENDFIGHGPVTAALGDAFYQAGDYQEAAACYHRLLLKKSDDQMALRLAACFYAERESDAMTGILERGRRHAPDKRPYLYGSAFAQHARGKQNSALRYLGELIRIDPYFADIATRWPIIGKEGGRRQILRMFADAYYQRGDFPDAQATLAVFRAESEPDCDLRLMDGWCDVYLARPLVALEKFQLLGNRPACPEDAVQTGRGVALLYLGRLDQAREAFERAAALNPDNLRARVARGAIEFLRGNYQKAISIYTRYLDLLPREERYFSWPSHALNNLGWSYIHTRQYGKAIGIFNRLAARHRVSGRPEPFVGLGWSYFYLNRDKDARTAFQTALKYDPGNRSALSGLAETGAGGPQPR